MSIMFNEICINEEMQPKYTYFKILGPAAHNLKKNLPQRNICKYRIGWQWMGDQ